MSKAKDGRFRVAALSVIPSGSHGEIMHGFEDTNIQAGDPFFMVPYYSLGTDPASVQTSARRILELDYDLIFCVGKLLSTTMYDLTKDMKNPPNIIFATAGFPVEWGMIDSIKSSKNHLVGIEVAQRVPDTTELAQLFAQYPAIKKVMIPYTTMTPTQKHGDLSQKDLFVTPLAQALNKIGKAVATVACPVAEDALPFLQEQAHNVDCMVLVEGDPLLNLHGPIGGYCREGGSLLCANMRTGVRCSAAFGYGQSLVNIGRAAAQHAQKILFDGLTPSELSTIELPEQRCIMVNKEIATAQGADVDALVKAAGDDATIFETRAVFPPRYEEH